MKKKLLELATMIAGFKAAWIAARKDKKPEADVKSALTVYQEHVALYDGFIADGKKDDDEVEIPVKSADVIELGEIGQAVAVEMKKLLDAKFGDLAKGQVTEEGVKKIVADTIKAMNTKEADLTGDQIKALATEAATKAMKSIRVPSKFRFNSDDASRGGNGDTHDETGAPGEQLFSEEERKSFGLIYVPNSLAKGNLPLHMKQLLNCLLRQPQDKDVPEQVLKKGLVLSDHMFTSLQVSGNRMGAIKALTSTGTGTGAEWVPRLLSAELYRRLYLESQVAQVMMQREIQMPSNPYDLPFSTTRPTFYLNATQNRESKASTPGSSKPTLSAQKLIALVQYSYESNEDSIIPILPLIETLIGEAAAASYESALINGDDSSTHQDSNVTDAEDVRKAWKGFRKLALLNSLTVDFSTGGITRGNVLALKKLLDKWGVRSKDLMFIAPPRTHADFIGLDDVVTVYAHGADATHLTGELPQYYGIPIVISEQSPENLNAAGVVDNITTSKGGLLLVNHAQFVTGVRREFTIEVDRNIRAQTNDIVASFRKAFTPTDTPSSTIKTLGYAINYNI